MNEIYAITIYPFEWFLKTIYLFIVSISNSYGISLLILSFLCTLIFIPLRKWTDLLSAHEKKIQNVLAPLMLQIQKQYEGEKRHHMISKLYSTFSYHPIYSLRSLVGILSQLPFLIGAYYMLLNLNQIREVSWFFSRDLAQPDELLSGLPLLPFIMTFFNLATLILTPGLTKKNLGQGAGVALLFLILLYKAPSALLIYWTSNNFLGFLISLLTQLKKGTLFATLHHSIKEIKWHKKQLDHITTFLFLIFINFSILFMFRRWGVGKSGGKFDVILGLIYLTYLIRFFVGRKKSSFKISITTPRLLFFVALQIVFHILYNQASATFRGLLLLTLPLILSTIIKKSPLNLWHLLQEPLVATLAIFSFHIVNNAEMLTLASAYMTLGFAILLAFILAIISWSISSFQIKTGEIAFISSLIIFFWGLYPLFINISAFHKPPPYLLLIYLLMTVAIIFKLFSNKKKIWLAGMISFILVSLGTVIKEGPRKLFSGDDTPSKTFELTPAMKDLKIEKPVNLYILVYDGLAQAAIFESLKINDHGLFKLLTDNEFTTYKDTYSLGKQSRDSMSSFYNISELISLGTEKSKASAGLGRAFQILKNNGYCIINIQKIYMTSSFDYSDRLLPARSKNGVTYFGAHTLVAGIFAGEFRFDIRPPLWFSANGSVTSSRTAILATKALRPRLVVAHDNYPSHTQNSGKCLPNELELYNALVKKAVTLFKQDLALIKKNDPNALIVLMSDHGPYLTGDCYMLEKMDPSQVTELMFRDRHGTFLAVKWPQKELAKKYDHALKKNQDLFPVLFSYLTDGDKPLLWKPKSTVILKGRVFRK